MKAKQLLRLFFLKRNIYDLYNERFSLTGKVIGSIS